MTHEDWTPGSPPAAGSGADGGQTEGWNAPPAGAPTATATPAPPVGAYGDLPGEYAYAPAGAPTAASGPVPGSAGYGYPPAAPGAPSSSSPLSTAAAVVGALALLVAVVPFVGVVAALIGLCTLAVILLPMGVVAALIGLAALGLGILALALERGRGRAVTGVILGAVAIALGIVISLVLGSSLLGPDPADVRAEVAQVQQLLDQDEYPQDDCVEVTFGDPSGSYADYDVTNSCDVATAGGLFIVDAIDANGHVIASGWGEFESLDASGRASEYSSYVEFDADVTRAAKLDVRDIDVNNALFQQWWNGEDTTIET